MVFVPLPLVIHRVDEHVEDEDGLLNSVDALFPARGASSSLPLLGDVASDFDSVFDMDDICPLDDALFSPSPAPTTVDAKPQGTAKKRGLEATTPDDESLAEVRDEQRRDDAGRKYPAKCARFVVDEQGVDHFAFGHGNPDSLAFFRSLLGSSACRDPAQRPALHDILVNFASDVARSLEHDDDVATGRCRWTETATTNGRVTLAV